jgi:hypothetical protein
MLAYAFGLRAEEMAREGTSTLNEAQTDRVIDELKRPLVEQYASSADQNRRTTAARTRWRARAGLSALVSVATVLALVALSMASYLDRHG